MGGEQSQIDCSCILPKFNFAEVLTGATGADSEDAQKTERRAVLIRGNNFLRPAWGGLTSQELVCKLAEDYSTLKWATVSKSFLSGQPEFGEISLESVAAVKMSGAQGLQLIASDGKSTVLLNVQAETVETRDRWVLCLNELMEDWKADPGKRPKAQLSAANTSNKDAYFKQRAAEIEQREKDAKVKREKYAKDGMKHVAQILASR